MTVQLRQSRITKRPWTGRSARADAAEAIVAARLAAEQAALPRPRRADGPDDRALYNCHCGFVFQAAVSTTVGCPHCGSAQAW